MTKIILSVEKLKRLGACKSSIEMFNKHVDGRVLVVDMR